MSTFFTIFRPYIIIGDSSCLLDSRFWYGCSTDSFNIYICLVNKCLIRNAKVGIAFGLMAKISEYFGLKTVSNVGLLGVLLSFIACCNDSRHCSKIGPMTLMSG